MFSWQLILSLGNKEIGHVKGFEVFLGESFAQIQQIWRKKVVVSPNLDIKIYLVAKR
jgi:hypothetical protein